MGAGVKAAEHAPSPVELETAVLPPRPLSLRACRLSKSSIEDRRNVTSEQVAMAEQHRRGELPDLI